MPEEENVNKPNEPQEPKEPKSQPAAEPKNPDGVPGTWEEIFQHPRFKQLNEEANQAKKRADALEKKIEEDNKKRLREQEDYKALYEQAEGELAELKPKAERLTTYEATLKETLDAAIAEIPENKRSLVPSEYSVDQQLKWISQNRSLLSKLAPIDQGAGERGGGQGTSVELTADELQIAKDYGLKPEEYAKYKDKQTQ